METIPNSKDNLKSEQFILFRSLIKDVRRTFSTVSLFLGLLVTKGAAKRTKMAEMEQPEERDAVGSEKIEPG